MLYWNLEASNDNITYEVLDIKIFSNIENPQIHKKLEKERNLLKEPGCTSTWGISRKVKEKFSKGFIYFLIKQGQQKIIIIYLQDVLFVLQEHLLL